MQRSAVVSNIQAKRRYVAPVIAAVVAAAVAGTATPSQGSIAAGTAAASGTRYGGDTSQDFPVVIQVNRRHTKVVRAVIAITLTCTGGAVFTIPDRFIKVPIKRGKFSVSFGPATIRNDDGTTTDFESTFRGRFNSSRTSVSGTWSFKGTEHDAAGAVTDTCESGDVSWSAQQ